MRVRSGLIAFLLVFTLLGGTASADEAAVEAAVEAADNWLALIDDGKYAASYNATAAFFRNVVTKESWLQSMNGFRAPLGKLIARQIKSTAYKTSLPGAPDGRYVVIQYNASFEHKRKAVETVTPMLDKDGQWRVSGYYIK